MAENYYDSDRGISEYLLFHYGGGEERVPAALKGAQHFPARCVSECVDVLRIPKNARALDLGCAVGRSSFELARHCPEVLGIDYSARFVSVADHLQANGSFGFSYIDEGELVIPHQAIVPADIDRKRVKFVRGDAVNLGCGYGMFDVILAANLIDRVNEPGKFLEQLSGMVKSGGQLVLTSPYTWLHEYTPRERWLGGFLRGGNPVRTFDALQEILSPNFQFARKQDLPFVLREHGRKFQLGFSEASVWLRR